MLMYLLIGEMSPEVGAGGCEETTNASRERRSHCQGRMCWTSRSKSDAAEAGQTVSYTSLCLTCTINYLPAICLP